ncbi:MAG: M48 family metallopeptidase [Verrucomicrobiota bacterium]
MHLSNPWFVLLLASLAGLHLLEVVASLLNLKRLQPSLPEEFSGVFSAEDYARRQQYTRESERFGLITGTVRLFVFLAFWLAGGFGWLDTLVRSLASSEITQGLLGFSFLYLASSLLSLPFEIHDTFRIEAKYGFNKTTPGTFDADHLKGIALAALVGLPLLALLLFIFQHSPRAWLWAWLATTIFLLAIQFIAPRWLMPLFHKFTPLADGPLRSAILSLASRCQFPLSDVFVVDGSRRSTKANAFFAGFGRHKRIALFDTLVDKHPEPELLAVLAHEIGHFRRHHIIQRLCAAVLQLAVLFLLMGLLLNNPQLFKAFGVSQPSLWLGFVFFMILFEPAQLLIGIASSLWSRKHEYEADAYAADATGGPHDMIAALKRLARDSLSNLTPHPLYVFLHYSHPPMLDRIAALRALPQR